MQADELNTQSSYDRVAKAYADKYLREFEEKLGMSLAPPAEVQMYTNGKG